MVINGKNLKPLQAKSKLGNLPILTEPDSGNRMDFASPLAFREQKDDYYILVTVDCLTRYIHAQVYKNCCKETALKYSDEFCSFHRIPRSIRCD